EPVLLLAERTIARTGQAHMEMLLVPPPRSKSIQPRRAGKLAAHVTLDRRADENAIDRHIVRRHLEQSGLCGPPGCSQSLSADDEARSAQSLALSIARSIRTRQEPDVGVEAILVARMPRRHGAAARRAHVTNQEQVHRVGVRPGGQPGEIADERRMAIETTARRPHHTVAGAIERKARSA